MQTVAVIGSAVRRLLPTALFALLLFVGLSYIMPSLNFSDPAKSGSSALLAAGVCFVSLAMGFGTKRLLQPAPDVPAPTPTPGSGPGTGLRDRLAQNVVGIGTLGIAATASALILALWTANDKEALKTTGFSIFTAVLPVFSTWVGTVLAFYFTNESFRAASESALSLSKASTSDPLIRPGTMVPYEKIIRLELLSSEIKSAGSVEAAAEQVQLKEFSTRFSPPGVTRVVVFDDQKHPVFVLQHDPLFDDKASTDPLSKYLDLPGRRDAAKNFALAASTATIDDGRRMLQLRRVTDLFVTQNGKPAEPCLGWVPDDNLKTDNA